MIIGFPLEADPSIGAGFSSKPEKPLQKVPQIEKNKEHFLHLRRVDRFMVERSRREDFSLWRKNDAK